MPRTLKHLSSPTLLLMAVITITYPAITCGADAALFNGAERAVISGEEEGKLLEVNLQTGVAVPIDPASFGAPAGLIPAGVSKSGFLLGITPEALVSCDLQKKKTVPVQKAARGTTFETAAYNAKEAGTLITCSQAEETGLASLAKPEAGGTYRSPLYYVPSDTSQGGFVFSRRVSNVLATGFAPDGTLYFSSNGDIWCGSIEKSEDTDTVAKWVLTGERVAPVATLETSVGTSASTGASSIAVGGDRLYVHNSRIGGSGIGDLYSIMRPALADPNAHSSNPGIVDYSKKAAEVLLSLRHIRDYGGRSFMTSTPDGMFVMYGVRESNDAGQSTLDLYLVHTVSNQTRTVRVKNAVE
jgi:hypothetical protein